MSAREPVPPAIVALAVALMGVVDQLVDSKLAARGLLATTYSSRALPPGITKRTFATWCRTRVRGASRDGSGWICSRAAWLEARTAGADQTRRVRGIAATSRRAESPEDVDIDALLLASGARRTR